MKWVDCRGDEWELKVGRGRVRRDAGVEERDEGGRLHGDDWGPKGKEPGGQDSGWGTCLDELSASSSPCGS